MKEYAMKRLLSVVAALIGCAFLSATAFASNDKVMDSEITALAEHWAAVKYLSKDGEVGSSMAHVGDEAEGLVKKYPGRVEPMIWLGIVTSERASLTWGLEALNFATKARDILLQAEQIDPRALEAGAPTSLGVLYYRVPGFPVGWGDTGKARAYLREAVANAPNGRDAHYFYADFLYEQGEYREAEKVINRGLSLPAHPERPLWDKYFPAVMRELHDKIRDKLSSTVFPSL